MPADDVWGSCEPSRVTQWMRVVERSTSEIEVIRVPDCRDSVGLSTTEPRSVVSARTDDAHDTTVGVTTTETVSAQPHDVRA
jgi:hypothetical protein